MAYEFPESTWPVESGNRSGQAFLEHLKSLVDAINLSWWLHNRVWDENATGRLSYAPQGSESLKVAATDTPSLQFKVLLGAGFLSGVPFRKLSDTTNAALTAPASDPRIDTIGIDPTDGSVIVYTGTESSTPSAPAVASGIFKAGEIYWRVGSTAIYDAEQSTDAYIQNRATLLALPGDEPHTSGLTVSGGPFVFDGSSGDITLPATGRAVEFDYPGENYIDASDADGAVTIRTGGSTDRLSVGKPADPIILHGSSHDLKLAADGEKLFSEGPNRFMIEQYLGTGIGLRTGEVTRLTLDENGEMVFLGSSGNVVARASGQQMDFSYAGPFVFKNTHVDGEIRFSPGNSIPKMVIKSDYVQLLGSGTDTFFWAATNTVQGNGSQPWVFDYTGAGEGLYLKTDSANRYRITLEGDHTIWGDAYFQNDVHIAGTLYVGGVPITGDDLPGGSAYGSITIPGTVFEPPAAGGSDGPSSAEFGSNVLLFQAFSVSADAYCMAPNILMPLNFNASQPVHVRVRWSANDATTDSARFSLQTAPQGEGDAAAQALNPAAVIVDANGGAANQMRVSEWTAVDVTGIAAGDAFLLRLDRTPAHVDDTLAADLRVHSIDIRYSRGAA